MFILPQKDYRFLCNILIIPTHRNPLNYYSKFFKYKVFTVMFYTYFTRFISFSNFLASK